MTKTNTTNVKETNKSKAKNSGRQINIKATILELVIVSCF